MGRESYLGAVADFEEQHQGGGDDHLVVGHEKRHQVLACHHFDRSDVHQIRGTSHRRQRKLDKLKGSFPPARNGRDLS